MYSKPAKYQDVILAIMLNSKCDGKPLKFHPINIQMK